MKTGFNASNFIKSTVILRVEASSNDHSAEVPEAVFPAYNKERLIEVWMVLPKLLLLDFSVGPTREKEKTNNSAGILAVA